MIELVRMCQRCNEAEATLFTFSGLLCPWCQAQRHLATLLGDAYDEQTYKGFTPRDLMEAIDNAREVIRLLGHRIPLLSTERGSVDQGDSP